MRAPIIIPFLVVTCLSRRLAGERLYGLCKREVMCFLWVTDRLGNMNDSAGEDQQQFIRSSLRRYRCKNINIFFKFFIYNLNKQSEFTFYKLMLWLLQCLDWESSSGESPVPQIRSIGQFLLSRLFSSLTSSVLKSGFSWVSSVV
jgi:hypothetical protein